MREPLDALLELPCVNASGTTRPLLVAATYRHDGLSRINRFADISPIQDLAWSSERGAPKHLLRNPLATPIEHLIVCLRLHSPSLHGRNLIR